MAYAIPYIIMAVGAGVSAYGSYSQGRYQKKLGEYQAKTAMTQAKTNEQIALQAGASEEASFRKKARAQWGANIVNIAQSGVNMIGSPLMVMAEIAKETELEAWQIRRNAQIKSFSSLYQGLVVASETKATGRSGYRQGLFGAAGTLMQGGSDIYKYNKISKTI